MSGDKNSRKDEVETISLNVDTVRSNAGKRGSSDSEQSGIVKLNESLGISLEHYIKDKSDKKTTNNDK